jgi:hypothetical protein
MEQYVKQKQKRAGTQLVVGYSSAQLFYFMLNFTFIIYFKILAQLKLGQ